MSPEEFRKWSGDEYVHWTNDGQLVKGRDPLWQRKNQSAGSKHANKKYAGYEGSLVSGMDTSHWTSDEAKLFILNKALGQNWKSLDEATKVLAPLGQYQSNLYYDNLRQGQGGGLNFAALSGPDGFNALPQVMKDQNRLARFGNQTGTEGYTNAALMLAKRAAQNPGLRDELQAAFIKAQSSQPAWVNEAYNTLAASPLGQKMGAQALWTKVWDLMGETGMRFNLTDPSKPLVGSSTGGIPTSGERFLRSMTPYEYFTQYAPYQVASAQHPENKYGGLADMARLRSSTRTTTPTLSASGCTCVTATRRGNPGGRSPGASTRRSRPGISTRTRGPGRATTGRIRTSPLTRPGCSTLRPSNG
jgi:hypothetical protein